MRQPVIFPLLIVGGGRAATALEAAIEGRVPGASRTWKRAQGTEALRSKLGAAETLLLAVSDEALEAVVDEALIPAWPTAAPGPRVALHMAGAWPSSRLAGLDVKSVARGVFHPVVALIGPESSGLLAGASVTISGESPALVAARALAERLEMRVLEIEDARRPLLHLGAVMAAGDLVALLALAEEVVEAAGLAREDAATLVSELARSALEGYARTGAADALTGPIPRKDLETLDEHAAAARQAGLGAPAWSVHRQLAEAGARLLARAGILEQDALRAIRSRLEELPDGAPPGTTEGGEGGTPTEEP